MINPFFSEFLIHPAALEYSGNTCTHNCGYCFSNIRSDKRYADMAQTMRVLSGRSESAGIMNFLLEAGYPVCMSNRTDPFSASNVAHSLAVLKILAQRENGIFFQTKGGTGLDDAFDILGNKKNVVFYITITTKNESVRKRMEPGAPKYEDRVELARRAKMAGYEVIVAINPCFEPWMPEQDLVSVESDLASVGVDRFIFQRLMLNKKDVNKFTGFRASQFADGETDAACKKSGIYHQAQVERQLAKGLHALSFGMPFKTDFFGSVRDCLGKSMPSNYDFFNWCFTSGKKILTFGDYMSCIFGGDRSDLLTFRGREMQNYIMGYDRAVWKNPKSQKARTFEDVMRIYWNEKRLSVSPQNNFLFRVVKENDKIAFDENGNIMLEFCGGKVMRESRFVDISEMEGGD